MPRLYGPVEQEEFSVSVSASESEFFSASGLLPGFTLEPEFA